MPGLSFRARRLARDLVRRAAAPLANRLDPPLVILLYHRVTRLTSDPQRLAVTPERFAEQLRALSARHPFVRLDGDLGAVREPSLAVTFDDGYADNAREALPILEALGVPATFFVATDTIGTRREFWWDELERLILAPPDEPTQATPPRRPIARPPLPRAFAGRDGTRWPTRSESERTALYREVHARCLQFDGETRERWLDDLRAWAGAGVQGRASHRPLTVDELRRLAQSPVATVGAHSCSHSVLAALDAAAQEREIVGSRRALEAWIGRPVELFSYPFGQLHQFDSHSIRICKEAGFKRAIANHPGQVHRWSHRFALPRQLVRDWSGDELLARLSRYWTA
jgi:peptidoglycan/xylan/chitin deacetylase (PgdA/CDA1 family)